jgi:hypothetical protein
LTVKTIIELGVPILAISISAIAVIKTSIDNNKMLEEMSRPYIGIYTEALIANKGHFYIVLRNFGNTSATLKNIEIDEKTKKMIKLGNKNYFNNLINSQIAPGQSITHLVTTRNKEYDSKHISRFKITYTSGKKRYSDKFEFILSANSTMPSISISNAKYEKQFIELYQDQIRKNL